MKLAHTEHVEAYKAVRPWTPSDVVDDLADLSVNLGIPWCPSCADWHHDDEPHSPMDAPPDLQVDAWQPRVQEVDEAVEDRPTPAWAQEAIDLHGRSPLTPPLCGEWVRVHDAWTTCRNPRPCQVDHDSQLRLTEDGYMTPGGCARLALVLCLVYLIAWVVIIRLTS